MQKIIDFYQDIIVQISTMDGFGSGFFLKEYSLIVTNQHVVGNNTEVLISGKKIDKVMGEVVFLDPKYDIAFVKIPTDFEFPEVKLAQNNSVKEGDTVVAIGHPYGFNYTATQGIVSKIDRLQGDVKFIQIDAAINPGNSGGPLIDNKGDVVGINSSKIMDAENIGFALPVNYLRDDIEAFLNKKGEGIALRCEGCLNIITKDEISDGYCNFCGKEIKLPEETKDENDPTGANAVIEKIISHYIEDVRLTRKGAGRWQLKSGNAYFDVVYTENGFIIGDARLCSLPKENIKEIYEFFLKENYHLEGISFSLNGQIVFLTFFIYDQDLSYETGKKIFDAMMEKVAYYDDILINKYKATRIEVEKD